MAEKKTYEIEMDIIYVLGDNSIFIEKIKEILIIILQIDNKKRL